MHNISFPKTLSIIYNYTLFVRFMAARVGQSRWRTK